MLKFTDTIHPSRIVPVKLLFLVMIRESITSILPPPMHIVFEKDSICRYYTLCHAISENYIVVNTRQFFIAEYFEGLAKNFITRRHQIFVDDG